MREMLGLTALREQSRITWIEPDRGWMAIPEDVVRLLSSEGFAECKRESTTSRRDHHPAGGIWQGVDMRTGSVASAVWVNRGAWPRALVFVEVDGESLTEVSGAPGEPGCNSERERPAPGRISEG